MLPVVVSSISCLGVTRSYRAMLPPDAGQQLGCDWPRELKRSVVVTLMPMAMRLC